MKTTASVSAAATLGVAIGLAAFAWNAGAAPGGNGVPAHLAAIQGQIGLILDELAALDTGGASVKAAQRSEGLVTNPGPNTVHTLVDVTGPGKFVSARLTKQGGDSGLTAIRLILDGRVVVGRNIAALKNFAMTEHNSYGVSVFTSPAGIDAVTVGFSQPLEFESSLQLEAVVGDDFGIVQMIGTVIHGE